MCLLHYSNVFMSPGGAPAAICTGCPLVVRSAPIQGSLYQTPMITQTTVATTVTINGIATDVAKLWRYALW